MAAEGDTGRPRDGEGRRDDGVLVPRDDGGVAPTPLSGSGGGGANEAGRERSKKEAVTEEEDDEAVESIEARLTW